MEATNDLLLPEVNANLWSLLPEKLYCLTWVEVITLKERERECVGYFTVIHDSASHVSRDNDPQRKRLGRAYIPTTRTIQNYFTSKTAIA